MSRICNYLVERNIYYSHTQLDPRDWPFRYKVTHEPTGKEYERIIWIGYTSGKVDAENQGFRLLDHWNKCRDWRYTSIL